VVNAFTAVKLSGSKNAYTANEDKDINIIPVEKEKGYSSVASN